MVKKRLATFALLTVATVLAVFSFGQKSFAVERYEVLQYGDRDVEGDNYVSRLQAELKARGYLESEPTGYFGVDTQKAVSRYQERHDLTSDGKAGPATQKAIYGKHFAEIKESRVVKNNKTSEDTSSSSSSKSSSNESKSSNPAKAALKDPSSIYLGDEGKTVKEIQVRLKELGYYTYRKTTSYYGEITEDAVQLFQEQNGLTADGVAGKRTMKKMFSDDAKKYKKSSSSKSSSNESSSTKSGKSIKDSTIKQSSSGKADASEAVSFAKELLGKKYRTGGSGPNTFDCSGFVSYVLKANGISAPRSSYEMSQYSAWPRIDNKDDLKKGDILFFSSPGKTSGVGHVGIYLGNGEFIHSSSGKAYSVITTSLSSYSSRYQFARRAFG